MKASKETVYERVIVHIIGISAELSQMITWIVLRLGFFIFGKFKVSGLRNLDGLDKPVIFAPNHANDMDPLFLRIALPLHSRFSPIYFVTHPFKKYSSIADTKFLSILYSIIPFRTIGAVPFVPNSKDYSISLQNHIKLLENGQNVCIFPEGKVTRDGSLGEPRGGVTYMATVTNVPIIPVAMSGTFGLTLRGFFTGKSNVNIHFGKPMYADDIVPDALPAGERYHKASGRILSRIKKWFKLSEQMMAL